MTGSTNGVLGNLVRFVLRPGYPYDTIGVALLIDGIEFEALLDDRTFDANWIVEELGHHGAKVVISQRPERVCPLNIELKM